ncbi:MAG: Asp-tRNA(Asn)/Glu-tRNA(Gln) amidotransferase subunit GatB [Clostridia bacterium]|nr:Asp-tRNA(Asn)/Glu-tRNA(Gln) amidotransferase subunit GatB [Clostridia bacterium]
MYEACIGLEVHVELDTASKAFCSCPVKYKAELNSCVCPVCMGLPGAMPVLNKKIVEYAVRLGLALNCSINTISQHARKNYFYPDLPKGYQISQGAKSICTDGYVEINGRRIRINRIHIEEDAGKLIHTQKETLVDFNRAGVPLLEIVTEPDIRNCEEARLFLETVRNTAVSLGISECRMEQGQLRCDVNVSVRKKGDDALNERCEMKNINSFSAALRSIEHDVARQLEIVKSGGSITRETRRWDDIVQKSVLLRSKESEGDYRYFPEPDLPPIVIDEEWLKKIKTEMPEPFLEKTERYKAMYSLSEYDAITIASDVNYGLLLDTAMKHGADAKTVANMLLGFISHIVNERAMETAQIPFDGKSLAELSILVCKNEISYTAAGKVIEIMFDTNLSPQEIVENNNLGQISDETALEKTAKAVIEKNTKSVCDYKKGKMNALGYLVGQCMKETKGKANPALVKKMLEKLLEEME